MTRAVVFLTAALAAASLGVCAQDNSGTAATPRAPSAQTSRQTSNTPGQQNTVTSPNAPVRSAATGQSVPTAPAASSVDRDHAINSHGSASNAADEGSSNGQLPQTSTILPLLGLIGLGSLVAGLFARR